MRVMASAQLLACVHDEEVTYVATSNVQDLVPPSDTADDPSPLLTPEPLFDQEEECPNHHSNPISVVVHNSAQVKLFAYHAALLHHLPSLLDNDVLLFRNSVLLLVANSSNSRSLDRLLAVCVALTLGCPTKN